MSVTVVNWNVEWATPRSWSRRGVRAKTDRFSRLVRGLRSSMAVSPGLCPSGNVIRFPRAGHMVPAPAVTLTITGMN